MSKQFYIISLFTLLALGAGTTYFFLHRNSTNDTKINTLGEWYTCRSNSKFKICDNIIGNKQKLNECYQAATDFANVCYPDHPNTSQECQNFWQFYNTQTSDSQLPQDYFTCVDQGQKAAKESDFFYKNNYLLLWVNCATSSA